MSTNRTDVEGVLEGYSLSWSDVTFSVKRKGHMVDILQGVTGHCLAGEMMAIMGPSGCGKTSLLDLLGDRVSSGQTQGTFMIGGSQRDAATARKTVSYVMQEDSLLSCFSVRETMAYAGRLSLAGCSRTKRKEKVDDVMDLMGLKDCADTRVGDPLIKGISGGQKRRLSIAIELLRGSPILLLDEPTSGLDSTAAWQVVDHLQKLAMKGQTVVMSIHQTSSKTYNMFSSLYLLSKGRQIYFGPTGHVCVEYFAALGHEVPPYTNPAEFLLDLVNTDFNNKDQISDDEFLSKLSKQYKDSALFNKLKVDASTQKKDPKSFSEHQRAGPCGQFVVLFLRMNHMNVKNPYVFGVRLAMYIALSFMVGTMYYGKGTDAREKEDTSGEMAAQSLLPLLFYVQAFLVFMSIAILPFFLEIRDVFRRERANGHISCLPYVLADFLASLPGISLIAIVSSMLVVFIADLNGFGGFFLNLLLSLIVAEALMRVVGAAQPHYVIGMAFGAGLFGMFMLCEGFMVTRNNIPDGWIWGHYVAFHSYSFSWFVYNQFNGDDGGAHGEAILSTYGFETVDPTRNALIISAYALLFQVLFFVVLYVFHTGRR